MNGARRCHRLLCTVNECRASIPPSSEEKGSRALSVARDTVAPRPSTVQKGPSLGQILASPKMLAIMIMAAACCRSRQLTESAFQAWHKDSHVTNTQIGVMSYVALPYLLKFLWAPFVDRFPLPFLGRRRGWILLTQIVLAAAIALFALQNPAVALFPVAACAVAIVFFSATQDIAFDAYRTDVSLPSERGPAAAATNLGYRTAAWFASAVVIVSHADF